MLAKVPDPDLTLLFAGGTFQALTVEQDRLRVPFQIFFGDRVPGEGRAVIVGFF